METLQKETTIYLDSDLYKALQSESAKTLRSLSSLVNEAVRRLLAEKDDIANIESQLIAMASDPEIQKELKHIEEDFRIAEYDGLEEK